MTRFWNTLPECVEFVLGSFTRMHGGETFVPRIPSMRVVDLARAMAPGLELEEIGIRPGEKLHEVLCPADDSYRTLEFENHFVICPTVRFHDRNVDHAIDGLGARGRPVADGWEYNSGTNPWFLGVDELARLHERVPV